MFKYKLYHCHSEIPKQIIFLSLIKADCSSIGRNEDKKTDFTPCRNELDMWWLHLTFITTCNSFVKKSFIIHLDHGVKNEKSDEILVIYYFIIGKRAEEKW